MKILIIRTFPNIIDPATYNIQEIGLAKALVRKGHECGIVLYYGKNKDKVRLVSYIDGPFFPDESCNTMKEKQQNLRDKIYNQMVERSKMSNVEVIKYIKK